MNLHIFRLEELQEEETELQQSIDSLHRRLNEKLSNSAKPLEYLSSATTQHTVKCRISSHLNETMPPVGFPQQSQIL